MATKKNSKSTLIPKILGILEKDIDTITFTVGEPILDGRNRLIGTIKSIKNEEKEEIGSFRPTLNGKETKITIEVINVEKPFKIRGFSAITLEIAIYPPSMTEIELLRTL